MLDYRTARDRAFHRAIETGEMPNMDLIHSLQRTGGLKLASVEPKDLVGKRSVGGTGSAWPWRPTNRSVGLLSLLRHISLSPGLTAVEPARTAMAVPVPRVVDSQRVSPQRGLIAGTRRSPAQQASLR